MNSIDDLIVSLARTHTSTEFEIICVLSLLVLAVMIFSVFYFRKKKPNSRRIGFALVAIFPLGHFYIKKYGFLYFIVDTMISKFIGALLQDFILAYIVSRAFSVFLMWYRFERLDAEKPPLTFIRP